MGGRMVRPSVRPSVTRLLIGGFLCENHRGSPTLALLNVLGVLGVLHVLNMLNVLNSSLACWALFLYKSVTDRSDGATDRQTRGRTDGPTDHGWMDRLSYKSAPRNYF